MAAGDWARPTACRVVATSWRKAALWASAAVTWPSMFTRAQASLSVATSSAPHTAMIAHASVRRASGRRESGPAVVAVVCIPCSSIAGRFRFLSRSGVVRCEVCPRGVCQAQPVVDAQRLGAAHRIDLRLDEPAGDGLLGEKQIAGQTVVQLLAL